MRKVRNVPAPVSREPAEKPPFVLEDNMFSLRVLDILEHIDREQRLNLTRDSNDSSRSADASDGGEAA